MVDAAVASPAMARKADAQSGPVASGAVVPPSCGDQWWLSIMDNEDRGAWARVAAFAAILLMLSGSGFSGRAEGNPTFNGALSGSHAKTESFGSFPAIVQCDGYEDHPGSSNPKCGTSPKSLFFSRFRGAPSYAKFGLMAILGCLASIFINESGIRGYHNRRRGQILLAIGLTCIGLVICFALMFA